MKIQEADEKLRQIADGKHRAVSYELTTYKNGNQETRCGLYIDGGPWFTNHTFEVCFNKMGNLGNKEEKQDI